MGLNINETNGLVHEKKALVPRSSFLKRIVLHDLRSKIKKRIAMKKHYKITITWMLCLLVMSGYAQQNKSRPINLYPVSQGNTISLLPVHDNTTNTTTVNGSLDINPHASIELSRDFISPITSQVVYPQGTKFSFYTWYRQVEGTEPIANQRELGRTTIVAEHPTNGSVEVIQFTATNSLERIEIEQVIESPNGNINQLIFVGTIHRGRTSMIVGKLDLNQSLTSGNPSLNFIIYQQHWGQNPFNSVGKAIEYYGSHEQYIAVGKAESDELIVAIADVANLNKVSQRLYKTSAYEFTPTDIIKTHNNNYLISGIKEYGSSQQDSYCGELVSKQKAYSLFGVDNGLNLLYNYDVNSNTIDNLYNSSLNLDPIGTSKDISEHFDLINVDANEILGAVNAVYTDPVSTQTKLSPLVIKVKEVGNSLNLINSTQTFFADEPVDMYNPLLLATEQRGDLGEKHPRELAYVTKVSELNNSSSPVEVGLTFYQAMNVPTSNQYFSFDESPTAEMGYGNISVPKRSKGWNNQKAEVFVGNYLNESTVAQGNRAKNTIFSKSYDHVSPSFSSCYFSNFRQIGSENACAALSPKTTPTQFRSLLPYPPNGPNTKLNFDKETGLCDLPNTLRIGRKVEANDQNEEDLFSAHPNPFKDNILLTIPETAQELRIYTVHGKEIRRIQLIGNTKLTLDLSEQDNGIYILQLQNGSTNEVLRVVKQ